MTITTDLKQIWADFHRDNPTVRIRDAAATLGVSEAELVATGCGDGTIRLEAHWGELLQRIPELGRVMALTRNESAVHERRGVYHKANLFGAMGQVVGADIDLRIFFNHWHFGFSVTDRTNGSVRRSFQFFDQEGTAVHKIHLIEESDAAAFDRLTAEFAAADQNPALAVVPVAPPAPEQPDTAIDREALLEGWSALGDTHEFFGLLKKTGAGRLQAVRLAEGRFSRAVGTGAVAAILESAAGDGLPIMVFVGNRGIIQIHTGPVTNIKRMGPWLNVLDDDFNLHLREDHVAQAWVVEKPTRDGVVTSLEVFDAAGENIALFFGKRKPGEPESVEWRSRVALLT